jgi:hypothetical protein
MPGRNNINFVEIEERYIKDYEFLNGEINNKEFIDDRIKEIRQKWVEMPLFGASISDLEALLIKLPINLRLIALKDYYEYRYSDVRELGHFGGGSIERYFKNLEEDINMPSDVMARLAIVLDIPIVFIMIGLPSLEDRKNYEFFEYRLIGKVIRFNDLIDYIKRPQIREITPYKLENTFKDSLDFIISNDHLNIRVDLRKSFFIIEFYLKSRLDFNNNMLKKMIDSFKSGNKKLITVVETRALLRDTFKLSFIGCYKLEEKDIAINYRDYLVSIQNGEILYPRNKSFEHARDLTQIWVKSK